MNKRDVRELRRLFRKYKTVSNGVQTVLKAYMQVIRKLAVGTL